MPHETELILVRTVLKAGSVKWRSHAQQRMSEREISRSDVKDIILSGQIIEKYGNDRPFPSYLMLGFVGERPIHVLVALDSKVECVYIVTVYEPDLEHFESDYKTRIKE